MKYILAFFILTHSSLAITARVKDCKTNLRVRDKANINSKIVGKLNCSKSPHVQVVGLEGNWVRILYFNKLSFIHSSYVEQIPEYKVTVSESLKVRGVPKGCKSWVNIRSGPGQKYPVLGGLYCQKEIKVLGKEKRWFQVEYQKKTGFIFEEKLEIKKAL
jgi:N-acetylmuramoyl-L-alanine amidase